MNIKFELLKVSKMTNLKIYIASHRKARNNKFGEQINIIKRVPLGTPQVVVMSLTHKHVTNVLSRVTEGQLLPNLSSKSNSVIKIDRALLHSNVITFSSRDIDKSLYLL